MTGDTAGSNPGSATATAEVLPRGHSGRRFVLVAGITVLLIWGALYLIFREWRAKYRERAAYGLTQVVPAIDPLAEIAPPSLDPIAWRDAVQETHAMLVTVISSNLLDVKEMRQLREELDQSVARARTHPETALGELAAIWNTSVRPGRILAQGQPVRKWRSTSAPQDSTAEIQKRPDFCGSIKPRILTVANARTFRTDLCLHWRD